MKSLSHASPAVVAALLAVLASAAHAQADPTRPHPLWLAAQPRLPGTEATPEPSMPAAHIVVTGPSRRFAVVEGEAVRPGESYNGSKLVGIEAGGVVWQRSGSHERATMSPGVEKTAPGQGKRDEQTMNVRKKILTGEAK